MQTLERKPEVGEAATAAAAFDAIVVGTSPLLLIEAVVLARQGQRVAVVEKRDRVGGAWYTMPLWEFDRVQPGCHYIERGRKGYGFLEQCLGVEMAPQTVKAVWYDPRDGGTGDATAPGGLVKRLRRKLLSGKFLSDDVWGMIKAVDRRDAGKFGRALKRLLTSPPYRYPTGGSKAMLDALQREMKDSGVTLLAGTPVESVDIGRNGQPNRCVIGGAAYEAKRLLVGRHALPHLRLSDSDHGGDAAENQYAINVVLRVAGGKGVDFDYLEIHRDGLINRVHDITPFVEPKGACSDLLVCCNLTATSTADAPVETEAVFRHLVGWGLLSQDAELVASHVERYPNPETGDAASTEAVTIVDTYDLGVELRRHADRWRPYFQR